MNKTIKILCEGAAMASIKDLIGFQGDLKELNEDDMEKLKNEMVEYGFNSPIQIWKSKNKKYIIDGNQRLKTLLSLKEDDGYKIPRTVPVDFIKAKNIKAAKHILLSRVKQYGKVTGQGLHTFMADSGITIGDLKNSFGDLPDMNMEKFDKNFFQNPGDKEGKNASGNSSESHSNLVHVCPECGCRFGKGGKK